MHYASEIKTALVTSKLYKTICKTIVDGFNVELTIVNNLCSSNLEVVTNGVPIIVIK